MSETQAEYETTKTDHADWLCECGGILGRINWTRVDDRMVERLCLYSCRPDRMATIVEIEGWARVLCTICDSWKIWYPGDETIKILTAKQNRLINS